jgi:hypothetical protein
MAAQKTENPFRAEKGASHFLRGFAFLPLLHKLVEERVGVRRSSLEEPLSLSFSPLRGARARQPTNSKRFRKKRDAHR